MSRLQTLLHSLPKLNVTPPSLPLTNFTLFSKLPLELRHKIIRLAAHIPREVMLGWYHEFFIIPPVIYDWADLYARIILQRPIPALLHTSSEFRAEGLRYYELCECNYDNHMLEIPECNFKVEKNIFIYANFEVDRFRVLPGLNWYPLGGPKDIASCNFMPKVLDKIKILDTEFHAFGDDFLDDPRFMPELLKSFNRLPAVVEWNIAETNWWSQRKDWGVNQMENIERAVDMQLICMGIRDQVKARIEKFDGKADAWPDLRHLEVNYKSALPGPLWDEDLCPVACEEQSTVGSGGDASAVDAGGE